MNSPKKSHVLALALCAALASCGKPLPIRVKQRDAVVASGKVATFKNTSDKIIPVVVVFYNPTFKTQKTFHLVIKPDEMQEIGGFEGWSGVPGDTFTLSSDGFSDAKYSFTE